MPANDAERELVDIDKITVNMTARDYELIGRIVPKWAELETEMLRDFAEAAGMGFPMAIIVCGGMDARNMFGRLRRIYRYRRLAINKPVEKLLGGKLEELQKRRNEIVHGHLLGKHRDSGELLYVVRDVTGAENEEDVILHVVSYNAERLAWLAEAIDALLANWVSALRTRGEHSLVNVGDG